MHGFRAASGRGRRFHRRVDTGFRLFWPLFMSVLWITGGLYFWFQLERHWPWGKETPPPELAGNPLISILIPCFNEEKNARETIEAALAQRYRNIEVIAINDGSSDDTAGAESTGGRVRSAAGDSSGRKSGESGSAESRRRRRARGLAGVHRRRCPARSRYRRLRWHR